MKFLHKQYEAKKKEIIEAEIDRPAKIKFMTAIEFKAYKNGRSHRYFGGLFEESPVRFVVPYDANWIVVIEKGTHYQPLEVQGRCRLLMPMRGVRSSIASDAPAHVRALEEGAATSDEGMGAMEEGEGQSRA
ncbi:MAG: DUF1883 domain-containing protein [Flavobacteriales bacterium]|nr:DUF1883 domain-containing protein [Flavobacteriales bacterium]